MGRFDNYVDNKLAVEQEEINKKESLKNEEERLKLDRESLYIPLIKKALLEFNEVLPKIKKWESKNEEITKSVLGIKRVKLEPRQVMALYAFDDGVYQSGRWIGKNGEYYTIKRVNPLTGAQILKEISIDEMSKIIYKWLPWDYVLKNWHGSSYQNIADLMKAGNAEEAVYQFIEKIALEQNV